jgi:hypothetical protein
MPPESKEVSEVKTQPREDLLCAKAESVEDELRKLLSTSSRFWLETDTPELRKQLLIILTRLSEARRLLRQRQEITSPVPTNLGEFERVLNTEVKGYGGHLDTATDYADSLERILIGLGDPVYVHTLLLHEACQDDLGGELRWGQFFPRRELDELLIAYGGPKDVRGSANLIRAVDRLIFLTAKRGHTHHRHARARSQLKNLFLKYLAVILSILISVLCLVIFWDAGERAVLLAVTAASAGALGSALTGVFKVRDELSRIGDLRLFGNALIVQPLVGASAGLLLFMVLTAGLPGIGPVLNQTTSWATFATYGFIAGFSEPFFLGVVQRVASTGDRKTEKQEARGVK